MNKREIVKISINFLVAVTTLVVIDSCGKKGGGNSGMPTGDLVGVPDRVGWTQQVPYGMVVCPSGTFHMGQADQDVPATQINYNKQITIGGFYMDETEITNNEYRQFVEFLSKPDLYPDWKNTQAWLDSTIKSKGEEYIVRELYPDTTVWVRDFAHHMGDPMMEYYYYHPAFDEYPVVGVDWYASRIFSNWRTRFMNEWRTDLSGMNLFANPNFRLPSEAEWEYAARGGRDMAKYPWGGPYIRNSKGCMLANLKPGRGNYYDDGFMYTSPVGSYFSNDYGLYDMSGNVSEWCEDAFYESAVPVVWDMNPTYFDDKEKRKILRGGSWKDVAYYLELGTRTFEYADSTKSFIGFRCAMTYLGRSSGQEF
ncbi:MAG: gliding motility lipoprotein GldK [Cytophagales bacterium]|nr:MAG: gliding motility lipoprotein GldK [Cytophagales bacterium]